MQPCTCHAMQSSSRLGLRRMSRVVAHAVHRSSCSHVFVHAYAAHALTPRLMSACFATSAGGCAHLARSASATHQRYIGAIWYKSSAIYDSSRVVPCRVLPTLPHANSSAILPIQRHWSSSKPALSSDTATSTQSSPHRAIIAQPAVGGSCRTPATGAASAK
eukprot:scaffold46781_cov258-Isochrysis_galbana.AAC.2